MAGRAVSTSSLDTSCRETAGTMCQASELPSATIPRLVVNTTVIILGLDGARSLRVAPKLDFIFGASLRIHVEYAPRR